MMGMKKVTLAVLSAALLSTGAAAQQYNGFPPPEPLTGEPIFTDFGPDQRPEAVMRRVRSTCESTGNVAQYNCRWAKQRLDGAFAEYRVRAANGTLRSQRR
jgi:hypothetical protein